MRPLGTDVTIADDESVAGSGLQLFLYTAIANAQQAFKALPSLVPPPKFGLPIAAWVGQVKPIRLNILRAWAREANAHANALALRVFTAVTSTPYTVLPDDDILVVFGSTVGSNVVINFPIVPLFPSRQIVVKNLVMGGFSSRPTRGGADLIDGASFQLLPGDYAATTYVNDSGSAWLSI